MDTYDKIQKEKTEILSRITLAASEGKTALVLSESENLKKIELLIDRHKKIILELEELKSRQSISDASTRCIQQTNSEKVNSVPSLKIVSSRELGGRIREKLLYKIDEVGISLELVRGKTIYRTKSGKRLGIAFATERQPDRWFLGLPAGGFDHAILLCQRENGEFIEVMLPEKFFMKHTLSESKGQIKFNIVRRGGKVLLLVPGTNGVSDSSFASDYSFLV
jgi:hypothetical protein